MMRSVCLMLGFVALCVVPARGAAGPERIAVKALPAAEWEPVAVAERPALLAVRADAPVRLDGALDEACWKRAQPVREFRHIRGLPLEATGWAEVRAAYDDENIYFGAELARAGEIIQANVRDIGGSVWRDDALEIFIYDPQEQVRYQLDVNALGVWWAGADKRGVAFKPQFLAGARKAEDRWTVEIALPWKDLGISPAGSRPLGLQFRYLVNNQTGIAAWLDAGRVEDYGRFIFSPDQDVSRMAHVVGVLLPKALPPGDHRQSFGAEIFNPSDEKRRVMVRILDREPRTGRDTNVVTEHVEVAPRSRQRVFVRAPVPASGHASKIILVKDHRSRDPSGYDFYMARRVEAMPPFRFELNRERLWFGDEGVTARLEVGADDAALAAGRLVLEFGTPYRVIEDRTVSPLQSRRMELTLGLKGLEPGEYRLAAYFHRGEEKHELVHPITIQRGAALSKRQRIPIRLDWPQGYSGTGLVPVYVGLSFPGGMLLDADNVRLVNDRGVEVPCQSGVLARWSAQGSIRWMGLRFRAEPGSACFAEVGADVRRGPLTGPSLTVEETGEAIIVNTGAARFEIPMAGPLLGRAWLGDTQVLDGRTPCLILSDQNGRVATEISGQQDEAPQVETAGPLHAVIRRAGFFRTGDGENLARYVVRLAFDAGAPTVRVQHSFINTRDTNTIQYSDIALRVKPAFGGPWRVRFDDSPAFDAAAFTAEIDPARL